MSTADDERIKEDMAEQASLKEKIANAKAFEKLSKKVAEHEEGGTLVPDTDAGTGISSMVGTLSSHTHGVVADSSSGGFTTSPPFAPTLPPVYGPGVTIPGWGTSLGPSPGLTYPPEPTVKKRKSVRLPPQFTEKVLLAFIDEENEDDTTNVTWAKHLRPEMIEMVKEDGEIRLVLTLSLEDVYGNDDE